jgi:putative DNA primase/helicase
MRLRYWREEWVEHDGKADRAVPAKEVDARLTEGVKREFDLLNRADLELYQKRRAEKAGQNGDGKDTESEPVARKVTTRLIGDVRQALRGLALLPAAVEPPAWLSGAGPFPAGEVLAARTELVHLPTLVARRPEAAALLQEWFGYCLLPDTRQQKILLVIGPKRSGKGTTARVLRALGGPANVAGPTLSSLWTNFGLWPLLGKTVAVVSDARLSGGRKDQDVIVERLLTISGEATRGSHVDQGVERGLREPARGHQVGAPGAVDPDQPYRVAPKGRP